MAFTFPNPNTTTEFTADNGITYSWDPIDGKWVVKGFSQGSDIRYVSKAGDSMSGELMMEDADIPGVDQLKTDFESDKQELQVIINRDAARRFGLSTGMIASSIRKTYCLMPMSRRSRSKIG